LSWYVESLLLTIDGKSAPFTVWELGLVFSLLEILFQQSLKMLSGLAAQEAVLVLS